ncbi:MAG: TadE family protein, partial [Planctomycetota bacterium]|nr:TadE family protein [Planctomycetota bacterium]
MPRGERHRSAATAKSPAMAMAGLGGGLCAGALWLGRASAGRLFVTCAIVAIASVVFLAVIGAVLLRLGAARRSRPGGQEGAAIIEFALALPIALMLVLIMIQSTLLMAGQLCVNYAAFCAARSAVVYVPADNSPGEPPLVVAETVASAKLLRIKSAAVWAVMPISSSHADLPEADVAELTEGLERFFRLYGQDSPTWVSRHLARKMAYAADHTE